MTSEQVYLRFSHPSTAMCLLRRSGLVVTPPRGHKADFVKLTDAGRALVDSCGPLSLSLIHI